MIRFWNIALCFSLTFVCGLSSIEGQDADKQLMKMRAFSKTFGCVRYFHPSDQASLVEWDQMAYYGTRTVLESADNESVADLMKRIFDPIVEDLELYVGEEKPKPETEAVPANEIVAWQHLGVGIKSNSMYKSVRLGRSMVVTESSAPFANLLQPVSAAQLREKEIRYRFKARVIDGDCRLQGWFRIDRENREMGLFDNMDDRPITSSEWQDYELTGTVEKDAKKLYVGVMFSGNGSALVDDVRIEVKNDEQWESVEVRNPDFEDGKDQPEGWGVRNNLYSITTVREGAASGSAAVLFEGAAKKKKNSRSRKLFRTIPEKGEVIDMEIADGIRIRMPLTLPLESNFDEDSDNETTSFIDTINGTKFDSASSKTACLANTVLLWNVFQHFYPYFEQVDCDWDQTLTQSLERGASCESREDMTKSLKWLVAQLHDGHGMVYDTKQRRKLAPVTFGWVENQLLVLTSEDPNFEVGDIVTKVGGKQPIDHLAEQEELISGSPQWKRQRSVQSLSIGIDSLSFELKRHTDVGEKAFESELRFNTRKPVAPDQGEICRELVEGGEGENIWYIDLGRAEPKDVDDKIEKFATAKGIVLDLRGYPRGTQYLFQHMTDQHMQSQKWQAPQQVRPNGVDMKEIETGGRWEMPPLEPRFQGKMVFITNASAISYAESCMSIVAHYKLGEIIGSPTAGANGNVNPFSLPGGYGVSWTGMRVMNHDDSQHHVRGVQPTIPMEPTIKGIRQGKDELLEKAIELIAAGS